MRQLKPEWPSKQEWNVPPGSSARLEVETQPEMPAKPRLAPGPESPQAPKGFVVLAIGLPGSGKTTWFGRRGITPLSVGPSAQYSL